MLLSGCAGEIVQDAIPAIDPNLTTADLTDGTYSATGSYVSPGGRESVEVTLTLKEGIVADVSVVSLARNPNSVEYQGKFISGIANEVVGKSVLSLNVSKVSGSSLTSTGFNRAVAEIVSQAQ